MTTWSSISRRRQAARAASIFNDPRRFGFMLFAEDGVERAPDAGRAGRRADRQRARRRTACATLFRGRKTPLKAALLDQRLIAGLGNIYVCEALWRAGLSPMRAAGTIAGTTGKSAGSAASGWPPRSGR